ncbi:cysteine hydrolase family protein [Archaeoglobus veneficus]|uniref:Isochorismatase hydrolase n=1 Tax=Archaeoglobus veneficus (strain DSM 11195 / SNP6) TaxID=693661 RepID=F2KSB7_ARCVS|nr:isochorismatase family cysteine hydrolase [Archaeoglobus veneficus]AEA46886.1 isochorismatase hydrolase [Archaeoglobus veneficus SNP6]
MPPTALLVIDMQKDFCYSDGSLFIGEHVKNIFEPLRRVVEVAKGKIPVIYTQDWHRSDDAEFAVWPAHCIEGSRGAEVIDELPKADYYVKKRRYSAFFATDLDLLLRELGVEMIYLAGVATNICVMHTAIDAVQMGYKVAVLKDCTASLDNYSHEYGLYHMENVLKAEIITSGEFLS